MHCCLLLIAFNSCAILEEKLGIWVRTRLWSCSSCPRVRLQGSSMECVLCVLVSSCLETKILISLPQ